MGQWYEDKFYLWYYVIYVHRLPVSMILASECAHLGLEVVASCEDYMTDFHMSTTAKAECKQGSAKVAL